MTRNPNIAVITIGYGNNYAFEDAAAALEVMGLLSKAVAVDVQEYGMAKFTDCTHFLAKDGSMPKLEFAAASKFNPHETADEVKARYEREQQDREDINQQMREAPAALPAPATEPEEEFI